MLKLIRKSQRWLTVIFIFAIGIVFVFFLGQGGSAPGPGASSPGTDIVVELDDTQIQLADYLRVRAEQEEQIKESLGAEYDAKTLSAYLDAQALNSIVSKVVLAQSARDLGLVASPDEVKDLLRHDPSLRDADGRFDQANFDANVKWNYGSQAAFMSTVQRDLLRQKLFELLIGQVQIGDAEALSAVEFRTEEVRIAFVAVSAETLPESQRAGDDAVTRYLEDNRESLQDEYDAENSRFSTPEQLMMRHILLRPADAGGDTAAADNRMRAEQVLERLAAGEKFGDLARELSDDSSSRNDGGKLGAISRGDVAANLEAVAFDLALETPSEIIEGRDGLHIVWVDEKIEASKLDFDEAGMTLAAAGAAAEAATRLAQELSDAVAGGQSLEYAARNAGLTLERTGLFTRRRDGFIPGLPRPSLELLATAFALTLEAPSSKQIFDVGDKHVLIQLLERQKPDTATLAVAVTVAKEALSDQRANDLLQAWIDDRRDEFQNQQRLLVRAALIADR